jgi:hypothetical protein
MEMSRESKIFTSPTKQVIGKRVKEYESFGWELLSINGLDVSLSRETQNSVYADLVKYEYQYDVLREEQSSLVIPRVPSSFSFAMFLILLLIFVIPAILYVALVIWNKKKYTDSMAHYQSEFDRLEKEIKKVCDDSRSVFFSRQK